MSTYAPLLFINYSPFLYKSFMHMRKMATSNAFSPHHATTVFDIDAVLLTNTASTPIIRRRGRIVEKIKIKIEIKIERIKTQHKHELPISTCTISNFSTVSDLSVDGQR